MGWLLGSQVVRWLLGWLLVMRFPHLPPGKPCHRRRLVVLIPARNEAETLPHLLNSLARQKRRPDSLLVVDDHSSDGTGAIAQRFATNLPLQVIAAPRPPNGWCGKTWALHQGVLASDDDPANDNAILVFLDADTEPQPEFLERLLAVQERLGGLVSVQPFHRTEKPYEQLSVLFNLVGLMAVPLGEGCGVAFGPAMATSRSDYELTGGHTAVANKVVEDWFLAHFYERAGLPVSAYIGDEQIAYRMYPGGIADMVIGFDKNFATAAGEVHWLWMLAVLLWLSGLFWAAWCLPAALFGWPLVGTAQIAPNLLIYIFYAFQLLWITRRVGRFTWINLVFPLPVLFFLCVFMLAILNLERGEVHWKGRRLDTR